MIKTVIIPNGILTLAESKAECPECKRHIPFQEIEKKWVKKDGFDMRMKCRCSRFIGIAADITGDFFAYSLK